MPIESISILYVGVGFLFVVLFGKALEIIVRRATSLFVGKKDVRVTNLFVGEKDLDLFRMELNELNIKIDALRIKLSRMNEQSSLLQPLPIPMVEDPRGNNEDTWSRDGLVNETSIAPTIGKSTSNNPWTRDVGKGDSVVNTKGVAVMEVAMAQGHQASYAKEIAPNCTKCGKPMLLRQLHPSRFGHYKGDFECQACGRSARKVVEHFLSRPH